MMIAGEYIASGLCTHFGLRNPMRTAKYLLVCLVAVFMRAGGAAERIPITIAYFENTSGRPELESLKKGFAEMLITDLSVSPDLAVVERSRLNDVLGELALQKGSFVDPATAVKVGKGLGAAYVLVGSYLVDGDTIRVDARLIDVENGTVAVAVKQEGGVADFLDVQRGLAAQLLDGLGSTLTLVETKRLGLRSTGNYEAFSAYSRGLDALDGGRSAEAAEAADAALGADPGFTAAADLRERVRALGKHFDVQLQSSHIDTVARHRKAVSCGCALADAPAEMPGLPIEARRLVGIPGRVAVPTLDAGFGDHPSMEALGLHEQVLREAQVLQKVSVEGRPTLIDVVTGSEMMVARCSQSDLDACATLAAAFVHRLPATGGDEVSTYTRLLRGSWRTMLLTPRGQFELSWPAVERALRDPAWGMEKLTFDDSGPSIVEALPRLREEVMAAMDVARETLGKRALSRGDERAGWAALDVLAGRFAGDTTEGDPAWTQAVARDLAWDLGLRLTRDDFEDTDAVWIARISVHKLSDKARLVAPAARITELRQALEDRWENGPDACPGRGPGVAFEWREAILRNDWGREWALALLEFYNRSALLDTYSVDRGRVRADVIAHGNPAEKYTTADGRFSFTGPNPAIFRASMSAYPSWLVPGSMLDRGLEDLWVLRLDKAGSWERDWQRDVDRDAERIARRPSWDDTEWSEDDVRCARWRHWSGRQTLELADGTLRVALPGSAHALDIEPLESVILPEVAASPRTTWGETDARPAEGCLAAQAVARSELAMLQPERAMQALLDASSDPATACAVGASDLRAAIEAATSEPAIMAKLRAEREASLRDRPQIEAAIGARESTLSCEDICPWDDPAKGPW